MTTTLKHRASHDNIWKLTLRDDGSENVGDSYQKKQLSVDLQDHVRFLFFCAESGHRACDSSTIHKFPVLIGLIR